MALKYNDGTYGFVPFTFPYVTFNQTTYNNGSTPDERGLIFQFPVAVRIAAAWTQFTPTATNGAFDIVLYDSDGTTALETISVDGNVHRGVGANTGGLTYVWFSQSRELLANTNYRLVVKPTTVNNSLNSCDWYMNTAGMLDALEGGQNWHETTRTDGGAWTQTTTRRPMIGLLLDGL